MKYPKLLKKGDTISIITPSFGSAVEPYISRTNKGIEYFINQGYNIKKGKYLYLTEKAESTSLENRVNELISEYLSKDNSFVWAVTGGEYMFDILQKIDFEALKNAPAKLYGGFSDNTNFSFVLTTTCDIASLYCIHISDFCYSHKQNDDLFDLLEGRKLKFNNYQRYERNSLKHEDYLAGLNEEFDVCYKSIGNPNFEGRIIGGCFDILTMIAGTKYDKFNEFKERYKDDGVILYLDSCEFNSLGFYRALLQLKYCDWFEGNIKGIIIGRLTNTDEPFDFTFMDAINRVLLPYNIPIILDADIGHIHPTFPIINGSYAKVKLENNNFEIEYILK